MSRLFSRFIALAFSPFLIAGPLTAQVLVQPSGTGVTVIDFSRGPEALRRFRALVPAVDSGGACMDLAGAPAELPRFIVAYPDQRTSLLNVSLWVNANGELDRAQEVRVSSPVEPLSGTIPAEERARIFQERERRRDQTMLVLDFVSDEARVHNTRRGTVEGAVTGSVRDVLAIPEIGPVAERARRAMDLCRRTRSGG